MRELGDDRPTFDARKRLLNREHLWCHSLRFVRNNFRDRLGDLFHRLIHGHRKEVHDVADRDLACLISLIVVWDRHVVEKREDITCTYNRWLFQTHEFFGNPRPNLNKTISAG